LTAFAADTPLEIMKAAHLNNQSQKDVAEKASGWTSAKQINP
jgi:hypothetical protein